MGVGGSMAIPTIFIDILQVKRNKLTLYFLFKGVLFSSKMPSFDLLMTTVERPLHERSLQGHPLKSIRTDSDPEASFCFAYLPEECQ